MLDLHFVDNDPATPVSAAKLNQIVEAVNGGGGVPDDTLAMRLRDQMSDTWTALQNGPLSLAAQEFFNTAIRAAGNLATGTLHGLMPSTDKAKLDAATAAASNSTVVMRDASGNTAVDAVTLTDAPSAVGHATRKDYVDAQVATAYSKVPVVIPAAADLDTYVTSGPFHQPSSGNAGSGTNYPFGLAGLLEVMASGSMVYQRYTVYNTGVIYSRVKYLAAWSAWLELSAVGHVHAAATSAAAGFLPAADKAKLDAATAAATNSTVVMRDLNGNSVFGSVIAEDAPTAVSHLTRKDYVDTQVASAASANVLGTSGNPITSASAARPVGMTSVWWATPTQPTNWANNDFWVVTP